MLKMLIFAAVVVVVVMLLRSSGRRKSVEPPPPAPLPEAMARCAHCGVYVPAGEAVGEGDNKFCSEEHQRIGIKH